MKKIFVVLLSILAAIPVSAQNEFGVFGALNMSTSSASNVETNLGGSIGALYNVQLTDSWWLQPRLILGYQENEAKPHTHFDTFASQWAVTLPVLMSFKSNISSTCALRINAGPYLQYAVFGRDKKATNDGYALGWWHLNFGDHFTYGGQIGLSAEYKNWMGLIDFKHSLRRSTLNLGGFENTVSVGVGYRF